MKRRLFTLFVLLALMLAFLPAQSVQAETPASPLYASGGSATTCAMWSIAL
jgi:hypothetical protein